MYSADKIFSNSQKATAPHPISTHFRYLPKGCKQSIRKKLVGLCMKGIAQGGHYVAYVKKSWQWYRTDDLMVTEVSPFEATH